MAFAIQMRKTLEVISLLLVFLGLAISFADMKGWFPNPRMALANRIMNLKEDVLSFDTPYLDELILTFLSRKYPRLNKDNLGKALRDCEGVVIETLVLDGRDTSGSVRIKHKDGKRVEVICGFQELRNWTSSQQYVKWIGWTLAFAGAVIRLLMMLIPKKVERPCCMFQDETQLGAQA